MDGGSKKHCFVCLESSNAFVLCRVRMMLHLSTTPLYMAVFVTLWVACWVLFVACVASQPSAVTKSRFHSKPLMNMQTTSGLLAFISKIRESNQ